MATTIDTEKARRTIIVVISMDRLQRIKDEAARARLFSLAGIGAVLVLLIAWFSRRATRPISSLAEAARRVASGDLDFEVELNPSGEIGALGRTFNEMLSDLRRKRELEEQLKRAEHSAVVGRLALGNWQVDPQSAQFYQPVNRSSARAACGNSRGNRVSHGPSSLEYLE